VCAARQVCGLTKNRPIYPRVTACVTRDYAPLRSTRARNALVGNPFVHGVSPTDTRRFRASRLVVEAVSFSRPVRCTLCTFRDRSRSARDIRDGISRLISRRRKRLTASKRQQSSRPALDGRYAEFPRNTKYLKHRQRHSREFQGRFAAGLKMKDLTRRR
jgi:hypothetical protein